MTNDMEAEANETTDYPELLSAKVLNRDETISSTLQSRAKWDVYE